MWIGFIWLRIQITDVIKSVEKCKNICCWKIYLVLSIYVARCINSVVSGYLSNSNLFALRSGNKKHVLIYKRNMIYVFWILPLDVIISSRKKHKTVWSNKISKLLIRSFYRQTPNNMIRQSFFSPLCYTLTSSAPELVIFPTIIPCFSLFPFCIHSPKWTVCTALTLSILVNLYRYWLHVRSKYNDVLHF
jgi:hypothetical protein